MTIDHDAIAARVRNFLTTGQLTTGQIFGIREVMSAYLNLHDEVVRLRADPTNPFAPLDNPGWIDKPMTDPITISRAQAAIENGLIEALQSQAQADMDGTTVIVSRQACDEAAEFLPALYDEVKRLRAERDALMAAGDRLSVCAQTTGGTAGRDDGLVAAITGWKEARQAMKGQPNE